MAEQQGAASFNPDDASGLLDNARVKITKLVVDFFTSKKGDKFVSANVTFEGGGQTITENYMVGDATQWAPNAAKNGVIALKEGGKIWNKSDVYAFVKSMIDSGFPKAQVGADLSVFVGSDVHVSRVTQEGQTYTDKEGKERQRTRLLVTKVYELPKAAAAKGAKVSTAANKTTAATAAPAAGGDDASNDEKLTEILVEILSENGNTVQRDALAPPVFIKATKRKLSAQRPAMQARIVSDAFLGTLEAQGLIKLEGSAVTLNG